ncbi:MAG: antibiotic acetyltransferase [Deltaproteobacteria bacterium]|jgi:acetyltransferase-like isoleucine patch superfamily enzyme|nr:antibiotic acetyltransferase [Deltaproteobacteria bacterium]
MLTLPYAALKELFTAERIEFVWRRSPGNEQDASVTLVESIKIEPFSMFISDGTLWSMGAFSYSQSTLPPESTAGRYCSFAHSIAAFQSEHPTHFISTSPFSYRPEAAPIFERAIAEARAGGEYAGSVCLYDDREHAPIRIGHDVWVGQHTLLKKGIYIGDGAVVAAGAVVTGDVAPFTVVAGVPAKPIRQRFSDKIIARIMELRWWDYKFTDFHDLDHTEPQKFLDGLAEKLASGLIHPFTPEPVTLPGIRDHLQHLASRV